MKIVKVTSKLTNEEKETILTYDYIEKTWTMDSTVAKHFNKALKQGWTPITQYIYEDGVICGMVLTAPDRAVTIRNTTKKTMSEKQLNNLFSDDDED